MFCKQIVVALMGLVLLQLAPFRSGAQPQPAPSVDSVLRNTVSRIAAENRHSVRVASRETGRVEGDRVSLPGGSVYLADESGVRAIALVDVDSVWIQKGTAAAIFGLILGVPGAVFGGLVGSFIGGDPDSNGSPGRAAAG